MNVAEISNGLLGAWRIATREEERARECFDLSPGGAARSFTALLISLPILFFTATALWRIAQGELQITGDTSFGLFITVEIVSTIIYWALFLIAMTRVARALTLGAQYTAWLITFNWGTLFTTIAFALPLVPYSLGLYSANTAVVLALPALVLLGWYRWQIARVVLGAQAGPAAAILAFDFVLSLSVDQVMGMIFLSGAGGAG
ncbi:MAG: hypothetical protein K9G30_03430 [Parvibaculum sp.]|nr:hypothetical protein [Parvibaculum sp.]